MCNFCNKGHYVDARASAILEQNAKQIIIHNVASFICTNCHKILVMDDVIKELQNMAGVRIKLIEFEDAPLRAA